MEGRKELMHIPVLAPMAKLPQQINYPKIEPIVSTAVRPFWSVMIPTYNRTTYLERTLKSVLAQDPGPEFMQIEVIDNCSTEGDAEAIVRQIGGDRVAFYRQQSNLGQTGNWTSCVQRARGHWVHILHDDDMLLPGYYDAFHQMIAEHPDVLMLFNRAIFVDVNDEWVGIAPPAPHRTSSGILDDAAVELIKSCFITAPSVVVARKAYEQVGGFAPFLRYVHDWEMWVRVATQGKVGYMHQPYFLYRLHGGSGTSELAVTGVRLKEHPLITEIGIRRLPKKLQKEVRTLAFKNEAGALNNFRWELHAAQRHTAALRHALWSFRLDSSPRALARVLQSGLRVGRQKVLSRS